ncbi:MAG TPA: bifunctional UDP-N-acetylglucosamine diphosphorylase/glucosamine-1-phosphate N-acetyltransferase GlmU [Herpetosiphonaceae bacterium]|nr:bifunctional UDP-N-acetylglucosamine diphosphorylase/glucosamine-1-phosphate N-acetyltransferase GlmU [Herpetosiphonaceae bacterium]
MQTKRLGVVILAAGEGTRMRSSLPKVLHPVCGRPLVEHVINTAQQLGAQEVVLVLGPDTVERMRQQYGDSYAYAIQEQRLGTGHAVLQARPLLEGRVERVLVLYGADPLMTVDSIKGLLAQLDRPGVVGAITTFVAPDVTGFGRIVRDSGGEVAEIVEEREATPEQLRIAEVNQGVVAYHAGWLWPHLDQIKPSRAKGELYLTDLVAMAITEGRPGAIAAHRLADPDEALGVNNRWELAKVEHVMRRRILHDLMLAGVTIMDPEHTYVDAGVCVGQDTVLLPGTMLKGTTTIGESCEIGPNSVIEDSAIGNGCRVTASFLERAVMEDGSNVGPMSHLRPGAHLGPGVHVGNFGEINRSSLGAGTKMGHFSYVGDAQVGSGVNIGAGTVTANYDGRHKHRTRIGAGAFIGSDSILRAPVEIGEGARTGAGSVVTKDVPDGALAVGVPARIRRAPATIDDQHEEPNAS